MAAAHVTRQDSPTAHDVMATHTSISPCPPPIPYRVLGEHGAHTGELPDIPQEREEGDALEPVQVVDHEHVRDRRPCSFLAVAVALQDGDEQAADGCIVQALKRARWGQLEGRQAEWAYQGRLNATGSPQAALMKP